jgi:hypothetical protein
MLEYEENWLFEKENTQQEYAKIHLSGKREEGF